MGIFDKAIERIASELAKAAPTTTAYNQAELNSIGQQQQGYGNTVGLPRDTSYYNVPFTPGNPILPGAINPVREDGRPDPRRYEFQVAQNINITETRNVPFKVLRAAADQIDILRRCVEVSKQKIAGLDWDIILSDDAVEKIAAEAGVNKIRAMQLAKEKFDPEITRLRQFWQTPDVSNGLVFTEWLSMLLEDNLVLDAVAVWPQKTVGGDILGLQILDGGTIKPLIDDRGMRPTPPNPAYQQILYGFPRSEFAAPTESEETDGEFSSDELAYFVRNRRTTSIYGYGPVERSLALADIYLRRQQWLRAEYTDGVLPDLMFKTDANFGGSPDLLRAYENVLNDDLAGQTEQRKKARILPAGLEPVQFDGYGEKFKDVLDEFLVTSICGHFGVQPSEIGFSPKGGLGGAGFQDGQAESSEVIGNLPLTQWTGRMLSQLSYVFLGMPRELQFKFAPSGRSNSEALARVDDIKVRGAGLTVNEARAKDGLALIDTPEADKLVFVAGSGVYTLGNEGWNTITPAVDPFSTGMGEPMAADEEQPDPTADVPADEAAAEDVSATEAPADEAAPDATEPDATDEAGKAAFTEMRAFIRFLRKSPSRPFRFEHVPATYAETINKFIEADDFDGARWYAERFLG